MGVSGYFLWMLAAVAVNRRPEIIDLMSDQIKQQEITISFRVDAVIPYVKTIVSNWNLTRHDEIQALLMRIEMVALAAQGVGLLDTSRHSWAVELGNSLTLELARIKELLNSCKTLWQHGRIAEERLTEYGADLAPWSWLPLDSTTEFASIEKHRVIEAWQFGWLTAPQERYLMSQVSSPGPWQEIYRLVIGG